MNLVLLQFVVTQLLPVVAIIGIIYFILLAVLRDSGRSLVAKN